MSGGRGADLFVLDSDGGNDRITDFAPGTDLIHIRSGAADFDDLTLDRVRGDTYVAFADVTLRLDDLRPSSLDADNFIFG